jgi:Icc protein
LRIAHISDLHLLEFDAHTRSRSEKLRLRYLSMLRRLDPIARVLRLRRALTRAREGGFDHLFITGDLTEDGRAPQFELLAEELLASRIPPDTVTLIAGNHDMYDAKTGWHDALRGPLAMFASKSTQPFLLEGCMVVPALTAQHQHFLFSHGRLDDVATLRACLERATRAGAGLLVAQHHPPIASRLRAYQWADGLRNSDRLLDELGQHPAPVVLHGHLHRWTDNEAPMPNPARSFGAPAVCSTDNPRVRFYDLTRGDIRPLEEA